MAIWTDILQKYTQGSPVSTPDKKVKAPFVPTPAPTPEPPQRKVNITPSIRSVKANFTPTPVPTPPPPKPKADYLKKPFIGTRIFNEIGKAAKQASDLGIIGINNPLAPSKIGEDIGKRLQKLPDTTIKVNTTREEKGNLFDKTYQPGEHNINVAGLKVPVTDLGAKTIPFLSSIPGSMVKSYGKTLERISTPQGRGEIVSGAKKLLTEKPNLKTFENPAVQSALDVSDFLPGIGFISLGTKNIVKKGIQQAGKELAEKSGKELVEKAAKNIPDTGIKQSLSEPSLPVRMPQKALQEGVNVRQAINPKPADEVLNEIRNAIQSGDEAGAKALHSELSKDFNLPSYQSLADEVTTANNQALKGAAEDVLQGKASQPYAETINKFKNFLRLSKEKTSKETGMLFREHIPQSVFGQSSDEVASALGKTENEFMQELLNDIENVASGKITAQQANRFLDNVKKAYKFNVRLPKPIHDFYNSLNETDYKVLRSHGEFGEGVAVSARASEKTMQKVAAKHAEDIQKEAMKLQDEWQQAIRSQTVSSKERVNQISDMVKEATDNSIKQRLEGQTNKVFLIDWRSPENVFKKLGLHQDVYMPLKKGQELTAREIDAGYTKMNTWFKELKGNKAQASVKIFDYLDGKSVNLSPVELKVSGEIRQYLQEWADKLGLSESQRITDYITHVFEKDLAGGKKVIPEELTRILDYVRPKGVFNPFLENRTGAIGYKRDVFAALDAYIRRSARALYLDEPIKTASKYADMEGTQAQNYLDRFLKNLQGRPDSFEKWLDMNVMQVLPGGLRNKIGARPGKRMTQALTGQIYRGALGLNLSSALKNLTQGVNTLAELGPQSTLYGYAKLLKSGTKELVDNGVIDDMLIADYRRTPIKNTLQKMDNVLFYLFETAEKINRGSAYFAGKRYGLQHGLTEENAIEFAKAVVRKTQFAYGKLDTPLAMQHSLGKVAFQFSTFPLKQAELMGGWVRNKEYAKILRYTISSLAVVYAVGDLLGIQPQDMVFKNIVPGLGPIPELAGAGASVGTSLVSGRTPDWKAKQTVLNAPKLLIPAGVQADKVIQGLKANREGGVYDKRGYMKYPIKGLKDQIISPLLGTYRTSGAIEARKK